GSRPSPGMRLKLCDAASIGRDLDRVHVRVIDIDRLDRADRAGARTLQPDRHPRLFELRGDLADRRVGDKTDMRRHALVAAHRRAAAGLVEMDLLLAEEQRGAALAHAFAAHAEDALVELDAAVDIGDGDVEM